ncbi:MAG: M42 family metallopeptidase [Clostridiaceae bacterium]|nr:M42 family metallopeptidase [Clostridiaceae bacterium]
MNIRDLLKDFSFKDAVSGNERNMAEFIAGLFGKYCDKVEIDRFGNIIGCKKGQGQGKKILVTSHYDEIGFIVTSIDEKGFIRFSSVGGIDTKILPSMEVIIHGRKKISGVIGAKPPHLLDAEEAKKVPDMNKLYIDTGMCPEELKKYVSVGDFITFKPVFFELKSDQVSSKSFDDRCSLAAMIVAMEELVMMLHKSDVYFVATVQEEISMIGAITASYNIEPDIAVVLDVCGGETPDAPKERVSACGKGPAIGKGPILNKKLTARLIETAKMENIPHQVSIEPGSTGTEARVTQVSRCGIPTVLISIPLKYMHTAVETISINDVRNCGKLVARFVSAIEKQPGEEG